MDNDNLSRPFKDLQMVAAVDISGSTAGATLRAEIKAIRDITAILESPTADSLSVLPWDDKTRSVIQLPKSDVALQYVIAGAGTRPSCIYRNAAYLEALRAGQLWILMTDGLIAYNEIQNFAKTTTELSLHGISIIVIVFGYGTGHLSGDTDTSVGLALYARSPDSLFLFHNIDSGSVYIISAKGSFKCLLKGKQQPDITEGASWDDLPGIKYKDLAEIPIQLPKKLKPDQLAFQGGLVIRLKDLFDENLDEEKSEKIANDEDSMASIVQAEMSSKHEDTRMTDWLDKQQTPLPDKPQAVLGKDPTAAAILARIWNGIESGKSDTQLQLNRTMLAMNHESNRKAFIYALKQHEEAVRSATEEGTNLQRHPGTMFTV